MMGAAVIAISQLFGFFCRFCRHGIYQSNSPVFTDIAEHANEPLRNVDRIVSTRLACFLPGLPRCHEMQWQQRITIWSSRRAIILEMLYWRQGLSFQQRRWRLMKAVHS
jgi:hypothetical protein